MNIFYYLLCIFFLISCGNRPCSRSSENNLSTEEITVLKEVLNPALVEGVLELVQSKEHLKHSEIKLDESFFIVLFYSSSLSSDTIVSISYFYNTFPIDENQTYYKGMLSIDKYNVAIFDVSQFGVCYYNIDCLKQFPLNDFKSYPMENIFYHEFYVRNGELNYNGLRSTCR